ncbi:MAG: PEPxxWA-CTERM sorting domain-containing protein [Pseudomonadota bacterium]
MIVQKPTIAGVFAGALVLAASSAATAATYLDGITLQGLTIGAAKYDVTFTNAAFDGTLTFNTRQGAQDALAAILASAQYQAIVPQPGLRGIMVAQGFNAGVFYVDVAGGSVGQTGYGMGYNFPWSAQGYTLATFALSSAVPEPATWAMMIIGFGAVGSMVRASRRRNAFSAA